MPSSRRPNLAAEARDNIRTLLQYREETWGQRQVSTYQAIIRRRIAELGQFPLLGRPRDDVFPGCRAPLIRQHVAYYVARDPEVLVLRVLHVRHDPSGEVVAPKPS